MGGNKGGREAYGVEPESHAVGEGEGGREASGVAENPGGGRHEVGKGFESPQCANTPRVAEGPRGDKTLGAPTSSQYQRGEERRGRRGRDENPPTARATRRQGGDGSDGASRGERTAAPIAMMKMAAGDSVEGPWPEHFDGADGARTKNGMHPRHEYDNVASEVT